MYDYNVTKRDHYDITAISATPVWLLRHVGVDYFHDVVWVNLDSPLVTDANLERLKNISNLQCLHISGDTAVSNAGLGYLKPLDRLRWLTINTPDIDDSGIASLATLTSLEQLDIQNARLSDVGLEYLTGLGRLRRLSLDNTQVTEAGVERLRKALPDCEIDSY